MATEIEELIQGLAEDDGLTRACQTAEAWAEAGRVDDLLTFATALEEQGDARRVATFESVVDHVEDQVALAKGEGAALAVLALSLGDRTRTVRVERPRAVRLRSFASRLAFAQDAATLARVLVHAGDKPEHQEILACWVHELVLRGHSLVGHEEVARFHERLVRLGHPLGTLPLELLDVEREAPSYMPLYGEEGLGEAIAVLERGATSAKTVPPPAVGQANSVALVDEPALVERLATAVRPWSDAKNGKLEAKAFTIDPPVDVTGAWLLRALPLDAVAGVRRLEVDRAPPETVFGALFAAAANGGSYSSGLGGAYGRRAAWTSFGALAGMDADAKVTSVAEASASCAWLTFRAAGPWFHDVAWDLGIVALRPDGKTVAVLAATDNE